MRVRSDAEPRTGVRACRRTVLGGHAYRATLPAEAERAVKRVAGRLAAFPGMQPVEIYPIHIVVEGGRVRPLGVGGAFGVDELVVETQR